ncbi:MAG: lycopene cyclase family protein, partial [Candidatus Limnocylindrales bacterium]
MTTPDHGDLLVIGGGSAGCVVAARASEDATRRVVLLEAGPDPRPVPDVIADPARQDEVIRTPDFVRHYPVERPDGSVFRLISGRVMGGGSAVNN